MIRHKVVMRRFAFPTCVNPSDIGLFLTLVTHLNRNPGQPFKDSQSKRAFSKSARFSGDTVHLVSLRIMEALCLC